MNVDNKKGIFSNASDRLEDLQAGTYCPLLARADATMQGAVALFEAVAV